MRLTWVCRREEKKGIELATTNFFKSHSEVVSHSEIFENWCDTQGKDHHEPLMCYQDSYFQALQDDPSLGTHTCDSS